MSQLKKKISLYSKNAADILKKLDGLTGLIYLNDNNNPTIGFLPQDYIIIQNENYLEFERQNFNEYKNRSKFYSIRNDLTLRLENFNAEYYTQ